MKKEVLFIAVPKYGLKQYSDFLRFPAENSPADLFSASAYMPLGLLSIQSYIQKKIPEIHTSLIAMDGLIQTNMMMNGVYQELQSIVELKEKYFEKILVDQIVKDPHVIGVSVMFDVSVEVALMIARVLRKRYPSSTIILGGHPATSKYRKILEMAGTDLDAISYGEGEKPFVRLLKENNYRKVLLKDNSFVTKEKMEFSTKKFVNDVIEDLDEIPIINYENILKNEEFLKGKSYVKEIPYYPNLDSVSIMTSRGCPHKCTFCASHRVHGRKMRSNSLERVKKEIDILVDQYGIKNISIKDDHFLFDEKRAIEICNYASSKGVHLRFPNGFAMSFVTEEFVECLVQNHIDQVVLALESGSERVLKEIIHKPLTLKRASETFRLFAKRDIFVLVYCVVGFPEETLQDLQESMEYLNKQPLDWVGFSGATPVSGSEFEAKLNKKGVFPKFEEQLFLHSDYSNPIVQECLNGDIKMTLELDVNYVHNGMMRKGKYREAEQYFQRILADNSNHAFAWYYRAKCLERLGENGQELIKKFYDIIEHNDSWRKYAKYFNLI